MKNCYPTDQIEFKKETMIDQYKKLNINSKLLYTGYYHEKGEDMKIKLSRIILKDHTEVLLKTISFNKNKEINSSYHKEEYIQYRSPEIIDIQTKETNAKIDIEILMKHPNNSFIPLTGKEDIIEVSLQLLDGIRSSYFFEKEVLWDNNSSQLILVDYYKISELCRFQEFPKSQRYEISKLLRNVNLKPIEEKDKVYYFGLLLINFFCKGKIKNHIQ